MTEFLQRDEAAHYVKSGITPKRLEHVIRKGGVRKLCGEHRIKQQEITRLAQRWGVKRRGENEA